MPSLTLADGTALHLVQWPATTPSATVRGTVLLVHGLGEHIGRYAHVAAHLQQQGWAVWGYDQRGHGRSGGPRGAVPAPHSLLADLGEVLAQVRRAAPAGPLVLLGHSLGGLIAGRFVAEGLAATPAPWWQAVDALVMSSPALDPGMNAVQRALLTVLGPLAPSLALGNGLNPAWVCSDPAVVRAYTADPLVHDRITPRLVRFIVDAGAQVRALAPQWAVPTLLLYAGADRCVAPSGSDAFAAAAPAVWVQAQRFDGWSHEVFNEPQQALALTALGRWLADRF
ncbi:MAG: alpha/beta hydrolase [Burkholderiales bacterium PBB5]|nr:MAG: alpha/beta hydrolase [Burkholderiales bacterium PBB5]